MLLHSDGPGQAVYTDNGATNVTMRDNVLFDNTRDWSRIHTDYRPGHSGNDPLLIKGNYWQQGSARPTTTGG